ncbi:MAG: flagellar biosynthesis protein FlhA, partial [Planctomycetales bacterium]
MSSDYYSLLQRYLGRQVNLTLSGQTNVSGQVAAVCYDGLRLVDATLSGNPEGAHEFDAWDSSADSRGETLIHLNQILAVSCHDTDLPNSPSDPLGDLDAVPRLMAESLEVQLGSELAETVSEGAKDAFVERMGKVRARIAGDLGLLLPDFAVCESTELDPSAFLVKIRGTAAATGAVEMKRLLAAETDAVTKRVEGTPVMEAPLGLAALWIDRHQREPAELYGYEVFNAAGQLSLQLEDVFRRNAAELFGRQQLEELLDQARVTVPALVDEVVPHLLRPRRLQKIL